MLVVESPLARGLADQPFGRESGGGAADGPTILQANVVTLPGTGGHLVVFLSGVRGGRCGSVDLLMLPLANLLMKS